jgi:hypothetical protein
VFLTLMIIGIVGLTIMAFPAFRHGHGALSGHGAAHAAMGHGAAHAAMSHASAPQMTGGRAVTEHLLPADPAHETRLRFLPSPRAVFSVIAMYGAFGNAGVHAFHLPPVVAALAAAVPALAVEWVLVRPLWNMLFRLHADASSPLEHLVLTEARAVVSFTNGRGVVSTIRDGRQVQLAARLRSDQKALRVNVGDRLLIESVDGPRERVIVSIHWN